MHWSINITHINENVKALKGLLEIGLNLLLATGIIFDWETYVRRKPKECKFRIIWFATK